MKKTLCLKEKSAFLFKGEVTIPKRELWLIAGLALFAGIVYGLRKAPWTHGVTLGSYNGCNNEMGDMKDIGCKEKKEGKE